MVIEGICNEPLKNTKQYIILVSSHNSVQTVLLILLENNT